MSPDDKERAEMDCLASDSDGKKLQSPLARKLGLSLLVFYGLGNILGAGIYVLIGKVAGEAGYYAPISFILAAMVAGFSAFSYAELSSRFPQAAGEAVYIEKGLKIPSLSIITGLLIIFAGMLSSATIARGFSGYFQLFALWSDTLLVISLLSVLGLVAIWGIGESVRIAAAFTILEITGLLMIIIVGAPQLDNLPTLLDTLPSLNDFSIWPGILMGSFLAFYAFIGFEDMVNVAEEVKEPEKNMPRAIILVLVVSIVLYSGVAVISILNVSPGELAESKAPLASVYMAATSQDPVLITLISLFAVINGALIQIIMAARVCYGMSRRGWLPKVLGQVSNRTKTPIVATVITTVGTIVLALWFPLVTLASYTSYLILIIFLLVNLSLLRIKQQVTTSEVTVYPAWIPVFGVITCLFLLLSTVLLS